MGSVLLPTARPGRPRSRSQDQRRGESAFRHPESMFTLWQNFAGMPEDQLTALPPDVRQMVMTGANAMMNPAAVGMAPMMDMSGMGAMGAMNMGAMGLGMNGEMNMAMAQGPGMMQDVTGPGVVPGGPNAASEQQGVQVPMGMPDGFGMGMGGMGSEYGMPQVCRWRWL